MNQKDKSDYRDTELFLALQAARQYFIKAGLFSVAVNILMLTPVIYMMQIFDRVITSHSLPTLAMLTIMLVFLLSALGGLEWVRTRILVSASNRLEELLRRRVFNATFKQSLLTGGLKSSVQPIQDLVGLRQFLTGNGLFAFFDAPWFPVYVAVMFFFHPYFGILAIVAGAILVAIAYTNEKVTNKKLKDANSEASWVNNHINSNLRNAEVIEAMGMTDSIRSRIDKRSDRVSALQSDASAWGGGLHAFSKTFRIMIQSLGMGLGAYLTITHQISPGMMIGGSLLLGRALAPIDTLVGSWKGFSVARAQYDRLNNMLAHIPEDQERMSLPAPKGELVVEHAIVVPPGTKTPVIQDISFRLNPGESLGIIGPSAAGKSTLARALLGIWPAAGGKVRLDGADIYQWDRAELGPYVGYLPQDIELFDGTISENICRFGEVDADKVVQAAQLAGVHELILRLPEGYDTVIGASGGALSGGQRQRIGLARALYGSPSYILLDEPNSNLDDQGERELVAAMQRMREIGTTMVVIAHRPFILRSVDKILVLKDGKVSDFGPTEKVLQKYLPRAASRPAAVSSK